MGRYLNSIESHKNIKEIDMITKSYLADHGFKLIEYNNEQVWRREGFLTCPQFIKIEAIEKTPCIVRIEAWLRVLDRPGADDINPMTERPLIGFNRRKNISLTIGDLKSEIYKLEVILK